MGNNFFGYIIVTTLSANPKNDCGNRKKKMNICKLEWLFFQEIINVPWYIFQFQVISIFKKNFSMIFSWSMENFALIIFVHLDIKVNILWSSSCFFCMYIFLLQPIWKNRRAQLLCACKSLAYHFHFWSTSGPFLFHFQSTFCLP